jgi:hypothetical protein
MSRCMPPPEPGPSSVAHTLADVTAGRGMSQIDSDFKLMVARPLELLEVFSKA